MCFSKLQDHYKIDFMPKNDLVISQAYAPIFSVVRICWVDSATLILTARTSCWSKGRQWQREQFVWSIQLSSSNTVQAWQRSHWTLLWPKQSSPDSRRGWVVDNNKNRHWKSGRSWSRPHPQNSSLMSSNVTRSTTPRFPKKRHKKIIDEKLFRRFVLIVIDRVA